MTVHITFKLVPLIVSLVAVVVYFMVGTAFAAIVGRLARGEGTSDDVLDAVHDVLVFTWPLTAAFLCFLLLRDLARKGPVRVADDLAREWRKGKRR